MDINQLLNELKETYSFSNATYTQTPGETMTDFVFCLTQDQITRFIQKAGRLTSIVESCANMISKRYLNGNYHPLYRSKRTAYPHL